MCHGDWQGSGDGAEECRAAIEVPVSDGTMPGSLYEPPQGVAHGGPIVLVTDVYGTVPFYQEISARLATAGHPTLLIDIFFREGDLEEQTREAAFARLVKMDLPRTITDASRALDLMKERHGSDQVGILGFCLGGLIAFDLCAERDDLVAVSYYGFPAGVPASPRVPAPRPIDLIDRITGPILSFWGEDDYIGIDLMKRFGDALTERGVDYEAHIYPNAGHAFLQGLVEDREDSEAARDSWERALKFFADKHRG